MARFASEVIEVETREKVEFVDLTERIREVVSKFGIRDGIAVVYLGHTTAAIALNEVDPSLVEDAKHVLNRLVPIGAGYRHDRWTGEVNAHAHILNMLISSSAVVPVVGGELTLGTWQRIILIEMDGPRRREVRIAAIGSG